MNREEQKFTRLKNVIRLSKRLKKYRLRMVAAVVAGVGNELCNHGYDSSNYHPDCVLRIGNVDLSRCGI